MPLSEAEVRSAWGLLERMTWELGQAQVRYLAELGLVRRRVFLVRDATGSWLFDVMEGSSELVGLGPEAVWATGGSGLDRWIAARDTRSYAGDLAYLPDGVPALDVRFAAADRVVDAKELPDMAATVAVFVPPTRGVS